MNTLATLEALKRAYAIQQNDEDGRLLAALAAASHQLEQTCGRRFRPVWAAYPQAATPPYAALRLNADLLELRALIAPDGTPQALNGLRLEAGYLLCDVGGTFGAWGAAPWVVDGLWAWHSRPEVAWQALGELPAPLSASDALLPLVAFAPRADGMSALQTGQLLRVGDELVNVAWVDAQAGQATLERGAEGSTAQAHSAGASVRYFAPPADVEAACIALAWLILRRAEGQSLPDAPTLAYLRRLEV